jgi:nucleoside-diphosphate-sugar epimerase
LAVKCAKYVSSAVLRRDIGERMALKETDEGIVNHLSPRACYDEGKRFAETCVETYREMFGIDAKIARVFTTYGPRLRLFEGQLIPDFIVNALEGKDLVIHGDKDFSTSLCYVTDMVDGLVRLMASDPDVRIANFGGEENIKYTEVAKIILKLIILTRRYL